MWDDPAHSSVIKYFRNTVRTEEIRGPLYSTTPFLSMLLDHFLTCYILVKGTSCIYKYRFRVLRTLPGGNEEVTGDWRRLHDEELHNLYASPNIIRVIKSRRMWWAEHVKRKGEIRNAYKIFIAKTERRYHVEDLVVNGKIILEWILGKLYR